VTEIQARIPLEILWSFAEKFQSVSSSREAGGDVGCVSPRHNTRLRVIAVPACWGSLTGCLTSFVKTYANEALILALEIYVLLNL
jgi:hypothetical protein